MKGSELIRKVEEYGKQRGIKVRFKPRRGKGSHGTLFAGDRFAVIPYTARELKKGTQRGILKQLGIDPADLR